MNDIVNWTRIEESDLLFHKFVENIKELDKSDQKNWVKWKSFSNQLVIGTQENFYKIYQMDHENGWFACFIREAFASVYRSYGIQWDITTIKDREYYYQIERRQKLNVATVSDFSIEDLLLNYNNTLKIVEDMLGFNILLQQAREFNPNIKHIKLIRECVNKYEDYAVYNKKAILLDDSDWFICFADEYYNWIYIPYSFFDIMTKNGPASIVPLHRTDNIAKQSELINKWWIIQPSAQMKTTYKNFVDKKEQMFASNIKLLTTCKHLPDTEAKNVLPFTQEHILEKRNDKRIIGPTK